MAAAKQQIRREFPSVFLMGGAATETFVDGPFPHTMSVEETPHGRKLKIAVTPRNHGDVSMVAVHYGINKSDCDMNFDINHPVKGSHTYVHITPDGGGYPVCPPGASYLL